MKALIFVLLAIASLLALPSGTVAAQSLPPATCYSYANNCDEGDAISACDAAIALFKQMVPSNTASYHCKRFKKLVDAQDMFQIATSANQPASLSGVQNSFYFVGLCSQRAGQPLANKPFKSRCVGGCQLATDYAVTHSATFHASTGTASGTMYVGDYTYRGYCTVNPATEEVGPDENNPNGCKPMGDLSMCVKPNGDQCVTASTGAQFCFTPGQPTNQSNDTTEVHTSPTTVPTAPTNINPDGARSVTGTTVVTPPGGPSTTTNVVVFTSPPTGPGGGTPGNGSGPGGTGSPNNQCDPTKQVCAGSWGGGFGCDAQPTCVGDPVNCGVLVNVWRNRCLPNGNKYADGGCSEDGSVAAFSCSGDQIACRTALSARERHCMQLRADHKLQQDAGGGIAEGEAESVFVDGGNGQPQFNTGLISFGSGQLFPSLSLEGQTFVIPPELYDVIAVIRWLVIGIFTIWALQEIFK